jgi:asparagine synthetase B (glutamine-hydrolysing)
MHTTSDSAVPGFWFAKEGTLTHEMIDSFDGIFAILILDEATGHYIAARDAMGVCPMYWGRGKDGSRWFSSEMKGLHDACETFDIFPPVRLARACTPWLLRLPNLRCSCRRSRCAPGCGHGHAWQVAMRAGGSKHSMCTEAAYSAAGRPQHHHGPVRQCLPDWGHLCVLQGHVYYSKTDSLERWYKPRWVTDLDYVPKNPVSFPQLHVRP